MMPPKIKPPVSESKLAWAYSLYAGIFAFLFSILIFSPLSGAPFAALAGASALICARLAGWIAGYFRCSMYGLIACLITTILYAAVPPSVATYSMLDVLQSDPDTSAGRFAILLGDYFVLGIIYTGPPALVATFLFHSALFIIRKRHWLEFQQRWL